MAGYDQITEEVEKYKIRDVARSDPFMRKFYEEQGRIGKDEVLD